MAAATVQSFLTTVLCVLGHVIAAHAAMVQFCVTVGTFQLASGQTDHIVKQQKGTLASPEGNQLAALHGELSLQCHQ